MMVTVGGIEHDIDPPDIDDPTTMLTEGDDLVSCYPMTVGERPTESALGCPRALR